MSRSIVRAVAAALFLVVQGATALPLVFESPKERVTVLELYTSHGCSSCPPADAWLRRLVYHPGLWQNLIPLSFHVDYWDYLGWKDRFARAAFSQRQRDYSRNGVLSTVYTPAMVLDGREWRGWLRHSAPPLAEGENAGRLRLTLEPGVTALLDFRPATPPRALEAHLAVLGFGISSAIGGGENTGKTLQEDFVVLGASVGTPNQGTAWQWQLQWPVLRDARTSRLAAVGWVTEPGNPRPLQAVAGWLR